MRVNSTLTAAPVVSLTAAVLAPPVPPVVKHALLTVREMAAVIILSIIGLMLSLGLSFRMCASPERVHPPKALSTKAATVRLRQPGEPEAEGGRRAAQLWRAMEEAEHDSAPATAYSADAPYPPAASREPWERTPLPSAPLPPRAPAPQPAPSQGSGGYRRLALLQELTDAAGASVDEAAPGGEGEGMSPGEAEVTSPAKAGELWIDNPLGRDASTSSDGEREEPHTPLAGNSVDDGDDDEDDHSPLPQRLDELEDWGLDSHAPSPVHSSPRLARLSQLLPTDAGKLLRGPRWSAGSK